MTYAQALAFIRDAHWTGEKHGLDNIRRLLNLLGNPQERFPSVHVAGTNGKGSVCAFLQAILRCAGFSVGLYTSPFLQRYNERIRIDGHPIEDEMLARVVETVEQAVGRLRADGVYPTEFEIGTAVAFVYFAQQKPDIAVVEVGLGGRLDPTNVLTPTVCAIARIGMDHTAILGETLVRIAGEKAGIVKPGVPLVLAPENDEAVIRLIQKACDAQQAPFFLASAVSPDMALGVSGAHQRANAGVAVRIARLLAEQGFALTRENVAEGLRRARWPGRLETVTLSGRPQYLLDGAHNAQGAQALAAHVRTLQRRKTAIVCGILQDKDAGAMVQALAPVVEKAFAVTPDSPRAIPPQQLVDAFAALGTPCEAETSLERAMRAAEAFAGAQGRVIVAGSLYLVGEARGALGLGVDTLLSGS